jgi:hypothetical protein
LGEFGVVIVVFAGLRQSILQFEGHIVFLSSPRVVTAGVPKRIPEVTKGDLSSKGTAFLLIVISALMSVSWASLPVRSF